MRFANPIAALTMFTKLPLWRLFPGIPAEAYSHVVTWWPFAGILTASFTAGCYLLFSTLFPPLPSIVLTLAAQLLLTGGYHEDGLADFFDGFGGGHTKDRILAIMKDSHIGTYGVIALLIYIILVVSLISALPVAHGAALIFTADPWARFCAGRITSFLPYARLESGAKNSTSYNRPSFSDWVISLLCGIIPSLIMTLGFSFPWIPVVGGALGSVITSAALILFLHHKIGGYTGDCCGAVCLMSQVAFYTIFSALYQIFA